MVYFAAYAQFIIERHQVYKEVDFKQSFTPSLWLVKITCCWKIHLSYSPKFYENNHGFKSELEKTSSRERT